MQDLWGAHKNPLSIPACLYTRIVLWRGWDQSSPVASLGIFLLYLQYFVTLSHTHFICPPPSPPQGFSERIHRTRMACRRTHKWDECPQQGAKWEKGARPRGDTQRSHWRKLPGAFPLCSAQNELAFSHRDSRQLLPSAVRTCWFQHVYRDCSCWHLLPSRNQISGSRTETSCSAQTTWFMQAVLTHWASVITRELLCTIGNSSPAESPGQGPALQGGSFLGRVGSGLLCALTPPDTSGFPSFSIQS